MGYRSDVHVLFYDTKERMDAFIVRCKMEGHYQKFSTGSGLDLEEKWIKVYKTTFRAWEFRNDYLKWYDSFGEVQAMQQMMHVADDMQIAWEFVRIGEDQEDIDMKRGEQDNYECLLGVKREITTDFEEVDNPNTEDPADEEVGLSTNE